VELNGKAIKSIDLIPEVLQSMDCVVVLTDHSVFNYEMIVAYSSLVLDTRNALKASSRSNIICL
jgi:UDP-N-acetyl-D-glucosamine dehydrogenase